ncbi:hypothetical protein BG842_03110 [Haladaptatus sp. W1]|nr:hypothetical protein BG842_03110 [Haladaptatus sp. W1]
MIHREGVSTRGWRIDLVGEYVIQSIEDTHNPSVGHFHLSSLNVGYEIQVLRAGCRATHLTAWIETVDART